MAGDVRRIAPEERTEGVPTPGMIREEAVATDRMWAGLARTEVGMASGWHHHGGYESTIYVLSGALRMEFGPGGTEVLEAGPGDFLYVAPGAVHGGQPERRGVADRGGPVGVGRAGHQRGRAGASRFQPPPPWVTPSFAAPMRPHRGPSGGRMAIMGRKTGSRWR